MPSAVVESAPDFTPEPVETPPAPARPVDPIGAFLGPIHALGPSGHIGDRPEIERELDLIAATIRTFYAKPPDQVLRECSAFSARLTELAVLLHRVEGSNRQYTRIRTQQVERYLAELDRQWKTASRLIEVQRQDMELMR